MVTTERTAGTEKLEKPLCALWYDPPSSRAGCMVTTEGTAGTEKLEKPLGAPWYDPPSSRAGCMVTTEGTAGTEKLEKPLCALCAPWYDPPSSRAGCMVTTESTEGTENGRNLCVLRGKIWKIYSNERNVCGSVKVMDRPLRCRLRSLFCPANDTSRQS